MSQFKISRNGVTPMRAFGDDYFDYTLNAFKNLGTG
jgi:hypothetical protein